MLLFVWVWLGGLVVVLSMRWGMVGQTAMRHVKPRVARVMACTVCTCSSVALWAAMTSWVVHRVARRVLGMPWLWWLHVAMRAISRVSIVLDVRWTAICTIGLTKLLTPRAMFTCRWPVLRLPQPGVTRRPRAWWQGVVIAVVPTGTVNFVTKPRNYLDELVVAVWTEPPPCQCIFSLLVRVPQCAD